MKLYTREAEGGGERYGPPYKSYNRLYPEALPKSESFLGLSKTGNSLLK